MHHITLPTLLTSCFFFVALSTGCYREKPITAEMGAPEYVIEDGNDYITKTIYGIYKDSGVKVIYAFNPKTAIWDMGAFMGANYIYIPFFERKEHSLSDNRKVIEENLHYLDTYFFGKYDTQFRKKYFPVHVFLADSVRNRLGKDEVFAGFGRDNLGLNLYRDGEVMKGSTVRGTPTYKTKEEYLRDFAPRVHFALWQFIFKYRLSPPELFYSYSRDLYGQNLGKVTDKSYSIRQDGFWSYDEFNSFAYYHAWDAEHDIADYVLRMVMYTEAENLKEMEGYQIMIDKYNALRQEVKKATGIDLQAIGNAYAQYRKEMDEKIKASKAK